MKIITKLDEFLATKPATRPSQPGTAPTTKPGTAPSTTPSRPSPIRRDKPSVDPAPKAKLEDVMKRFMTELRKNKTPMEFDLGKLKAKYND
jgi:hypothetical protein